MTEKTQEKSKRQETLVPLDQYLATGIHIGTQRVLKDMKKFVYKVRPDGVSVLDIATIDQRIRVLAKFLSRFKPEKIMVVCSRDTGKKPVQKFAELIGANAITTRFMPGSLTNPAFENHLEPDVLLIVDPGVDKQALMEALKMNIPIASLANSNNMTQNIDLILPVNNRGKKSLALVFWLLSREILKLQGKIKNDSDFTLKPEDFEAEEKEESK